MREEGGVVAVTSLSLEACIAQGPGVSVLCKHAVELRAALQAAILRGVEGIISFGIAGGLAPDLTAGDWVVASRVRHGDQVFPTDKNWTRNLLSAIPHAVYAEIAGADELIMTAVHKRDIHTRSGAVAVDMESHIAAKVAFESGIPFVACRAIIDAADRTLPPAAAVGLRPDGKPDLPAVLRSVMQRPDQIPDLIRTALDAHVARRALRLGRKQLGAALAFPDYDASAAKLASPCAVGCAFPESESFATAS